MSKQLSTIDKGLITGLTEKVKSVLSSNQMEAFEKTFIMADAIKAMRELMTPEVMAPIMELQGSQLGFKTDKDKNKDGSKGQGYPMELVRDCVITATLMGVTPVGNQFNIIAGGTYITKEGYEYLLKNMGLAYTVTNELPRISGEKAAIVMILKWEADGQKFSQSLDLPIKINSFMGADAVIGKGKRKALAWLHAKATGLNFTDGDIDDQGRANVVETKIPPDQQRMIDLLAADDYENIEHFEAMIKSCSDELITMFQNEIEEKRQSFKTGDK